MAAVSYVGQKHRHALEVYKTCTETSCQIALSPPAMVLELSRKFPLSHIPGQPSFDVQVRPLSLFTISTAKTTVSDVPFMCYPLKVHLLVVKSKNSIFGGLNKEQ